MNEESKMTYIFSKNFPEPINPLFKTDIFPDNTREQCWQTWINSFPDQRQAHDGRDTEEYWAKNIVKCLRQEIGVALLIETEIKINGPSSFGPWTDTDYKAELFEFFKKGLKGEDTSKNVNRAFLVLELLANSYYSHSHHTRLVNNFNFYLRQADIGYQIIDKELIPYMDQNLLESAVYPTISLLNQEIFKEAREYYSQVFDLYKQNNFEGALDAMSKAYEAVIKIILRQRNIELPQKPTLCTLINKIKEHNIIPGIDKNIHNSVIKLLETSALIRNQSAGHAHVEGEERVKADSKISLLMIHHTSSNILYLAQCCVNL